MEKKIKVKDYSKYIISEIILLLLTLGLMISVYYQFNFINSIDNFVFKIYEFIRNNIVNNIFFIFTLMGESYVIITILVVLLLLPTRKRNVFIALFTIMSAIMNELLKIIIARPRPIGQFVNNLLFKYKFPNGFSFPSGHAQTASVFYFLLFHLLIKYYYKGKHKKLLNIISIAIPIMISISRVVIGVHYFTDILCGLLIASMIIILYLLLEKIYLSSSK